MIGTIFVDNNIIKEDFQSGFHLFFIPGVTKVEASITRHNRKITFRWPELILQHKTPRSSTKDFLNLI